MLDLRAVFGTSVPMMALWLLFAGGAVLSGYPGVLCITPLAWLLGMVAGQRVVLKSASSTRGQRLTEAALAGALVGLWEGIVGAAILLFFSPMGGGLSLIETLALAAITLVIACGVSALACALLGLGLGAVQLRRIPLE